MKTNVKSRLFRALHAEASRKGLDHDALRDIAKERFGVESMSVLTVDNLQHLHRDLTGRWFHARKAPLPKRGTAAAGEMEIISPGHLETLARAFAKRGWGRDTQRAFIRRQLRGREQIRTTADFQKVFRGVQAMNRRDGLKGA
ncbi:hypothetical protein LCGC14_1330380 [marine sediment metagenome]|uniref:Regulatory protein GemA n=1 Tax=marine sediment metagenome TaxID=412755 RepID=A0A0F9KGT9_9ZZZZ